jgi:hypothetical protein
LYVQVIKSSSASWFTVLVGLGTLYLLLVGVKMLISVLLLGYSAEVVLHSGFGSGEEEDGMKKKQAPSARAALIQSPDVKGPRSPTTAPRHRSGQVPEAVRSPFVMITPERRPPVSDQEQLTGLLSVSRYSLVSGRIPI